MKQEVYLDKNNKLVICTDNGKIDRENNTTTVLEGNFTISAYNVAKLCALLNDTIFINKSIYENFINSQYSLITTDEKLKAMLRCKDDDYKALNDAYHECCIAYNKLKAKVEEYNARPFSRKIKLD